MLFNSIEFLIFFSIVVPLYFVLPHRFRWLMLLCASCVFYMFFVPSYILILLITISIDYLAAIYIYRTTGYTKKLLLIVSIVSTCFILFIFKYIDFALGSLNSILSFTGSGSPIPLLRIVLPIGLSFHTFQSLSYVVEVYRGRQKPEHHFGIYSLYVMFYPQLVAGPIERPQNLLHQFYERHSPDPDRISNGLKLLLWGFFKKLVVADRLAIYVNAVYNNQTSHSGITLLVATVFFAFQIYADFSGYSDIAIGTARVMGFNLMNNFNRPYFAKSIREFWQRWHISLSTWFRDYLYIPLGGSRVGRLHWCYNIAVVFIVSGLWHGANWTFLIWGMLHGMFLIFSNLTEKLRQYLARWINGSYFSRFYEFIRMTITFGLVTLAWVFFRSNTVSDAFDILHKIFLLHGELYIGTPSIFMYCILGIATLVLADFRNEYLPRSISLFDNDNFLIRLLSYSGATITILVFGVFDGGQFIYFQF